MDTVIHDGAPNVGGAWASEAYSQSWLVLESLKLACEFLAPRGTFVTKIFRLLSPTQCFPQLRQVPLMHNRQSGAASQLSKAECCCTNSTV